MKRVISLLLAVLFCLSLCACSGNSGSPSNAGSQGVQTNSGKHTSTVTCTACNGSKKCTVCYGNSECFECDGTGISRCWDCLGDGECLNCSGDGGSYEYNFYSGKSEWRKCSTCYGSGKCRGCGGDAQTTCQSCYGGKSSCSACYGSGVCGLCGGKGKITQSTSSQTNSNTSQNQSAQNHTVDPNDTTNVLRATINGTEYQFEMVSASVKTDLQKNFKYIQVHCQATNPRGELLYEMYFGFDANLTTGTYQIIGDNYALDLGCTVTQVNGGQSFHSTRSNQSVNVGSFTISEMSADWRTYSGSFYVTLQSNPGSQTMDVRVSYFNFSLL